MQMNETGNGRPNTGQSFPSATSDLALVSSSSSSSQNQAGMIQLNDAMNIQNDQISQCEDDSPRIQPSCLHRNDISQPLLSECDECDESDVVTPLGSNQPPREKKIAFSKQETDTKSTKETATTPKRSADAMDVDSTGNHRVTSLVIQMQALEEKIQRAASVELRYLQSLEEVTQKRMRLEEKQREAISRRPRAISGSSSAALESYITDANEKLAKAIKAETAYKRRVKELHDKRYRWSKLHENAGRELLELDPSRVIPSLPPLFTPSFLRR